MATEFQNLDTTLNALATNTRPVPQKEVHKKIPESAEAVRPLETGFQINERPLFSTDDLKQAIEVLNRNLEMTQRNLAFSIDGVTGKNVVRVNNTVTGELIRQLPSEELLQFSRNLESMIGLLFDKRT
jgi:uncharacterized FlaG/YvyC family protein